MPGQFGPESGGQHLHNIHFNRTQHGFSGLKTNDSPLHIKSVLRNLLLETLSKTFTTQGEYDEWHKNSCDSLIKCCKDATTYEMQYGQAQKWINMSLKYMFALGDSRIPGISKNYQWFHIPIDNIIQDILLKEGLPKFRISWSRINNYDGYLDYQKQFRSLYPNEIPIEKELKLFNQLE